MPCPDAILRLIERFEHQLDQVKNPDYNETQLRIDFVNPMFRELGWDIDNTHGYAEQYREVVHEDRVRVAGATKAPDYSFRVGGNRKFFLEAKKPFINIKENWEPAYQLRRYAWSAKLPASLLTDFEELAIYDCRIQPKQLDKASVARREYITYRQYPEQWEFLASTFSKDAVLRGDFDRYCGTTRGRGAQEFDDAFLEEIEEWRKKLANNIALRNEALDERGLNFAVQRIIDRIIFLRICEDRGIEHVGQLRALLNAEEVYPRLSKLFRDADDRYNSGLFYFRAEKGRDEPPDELTPGLDIDDATLKQIIRRLYYPDSPYEFTVVSADILGSVYERFLGKIITLTGGHRAKIEEKPEVRKAGGVYYTPTYIVDYIVQQTVGKLLEGKTPKEASKLKILDPACGSGSFLIGAYQYLLDWHLKWYIEHEPGKWCQGKNAALRPAEPGAGGKSEIRITKSETNSNAQTRKIQNTPNAADAPDAAGAVSSISSSNLEIVSNIDIRDSNLSTNYRLTIKERKRILIDNIHGVDIDYQAVEVTKLSLLLKVLEGETAESVGGLLRLFHERALPDLGHNIQCGNSLIGSDIMISPVWARMTEAERFRVNPFDYARAFPKVVDQGGFDAVIGNPPWGASFTETELAYLRERYSRVVDRMVDSYIYLIDQGLRVKRAGGFLGFIVPGTVVNQVDACQVRGILIDDGIQTVLNLGQDIFTTRVLNTSAIVISGGMKGDSVLIGSVVQLPLKDRAPALRSVPVSPRAEWESLVASNPNRTFYVESVQAATLYGRLASVHPRLDSIINGAIERGVSPDIVAAHVLTDEQQERERIESELLRRSISGSQIRRYAPWHPDEWIIYTARSTLIKEYSRAARYLARFASQNSCPEVRDGKHAYWALHRPRNPEIFASPKFIGLTTTKTIQLIYDETENLVVTDAMYVFSLSAPANAMAVMGILLSGLFLFLYRVANQGEGRVIPQVKAAKLGPLPIPDLSVHMELKVRIENAVSEMLGLQQRKQTLKLAHMREQMQRQIDATDRRIDQLVYEVYGLTQEEIRIVEGSHAANAGAAAG